MEDIANKTSSIRGYRIADHNIINSRVSLYNIINYDIANSRGSICDIINYGIVNLRVWLCDIFNCALSIREYRFMILSTTHYRFESIDLYLFDLYVLICNRTILSIYKCRFTRVDYDSVVLLESIYRVEL